MFRNYLNAALRNLVRNRLFAAINLVGLAVGFAAALLIALFVRDEFSYDRFFPDHERIYLFATAIDLPGRASTPSDYSGAEFGPLLRNDFPEIADVARLWPSGGSSLRVGEQENLELTLWADPNIFDLLIFRVAFGSLDGALAKPDSIVVTRKLAQKYFGRDNVIGETIEFDRKHPMTVTAVIETLPSNTHLLGDVIAAGHAAHSPIAQLDANPPGPAVFNVNAQIYLKFTDAAAAARVQEGLPAFLKRHKSKLDPTFAPKFSLIPIAALHLSPGSTFVLKPRGRIETVAALAAIGVLIVVAATINFVNLTTARAGRRATEIGVRKVAGARGRQLMAQFLGESVLYVMLGIALAAGLTALLLPQLNAFLQRTIEIGVFDSFGPLAFVIGLGISVGVLAGVYPAFVLSAFRPASVLKAGTYRSHGSAVVRQGLVIVQFALLIGLLVASGVVYRQTQFAATEAQRIDFDQVVGMASPCQGSLREAVAAVPGVIAVACSGGLEMGRGELVGPLTARDGTEIVIAQHRVEAGTLEFLGFQPVAGRFFSKDRVADAVPEDKDATMRAPVVLNEAAVRVLGYASPAEAIGRTTTIKGVRPTTEPSEIIGVVPDFTIDAVHKDVPPIVYFIQPERLYVMYMRVDGSRMPEALEGIDKAWKQHGLPRPISRFFMDRNVAAFYADITQQGQLLTTFAAVAVFISVLGLFGMCVAIAERRVKEIGIRKAMGATRGEVVRMLVWQFTQPVLWANLIAWPVAFLVMRRWLEGFANHVDLELWVFAAATAAAGLVAVITVTLHAFFAAGTRPADALRYE